MIIMIKKMYKLFKINFKNRNETVTIDYLIDVHQGEHIAPLLFILIFQTKIDPLELTDKRQGIKIPSYRYFPDAAKREPRGRMICQFF